MQREPWPFNGSIPADQETYWDARRLIAAAFTLCDLRADFWSLPAADTQGNPVDLGEETAWLRRYFLDCLEFSLDAGAEPGSLFDDFGGGREGIELGRDATDEWVRIEWSFDGRGHEDDGGDYAFSLNVTDSDESAVWVDADVMQDAPTVRAAIADARRALASTKPVL